MKNPLGLTLASLALSLPACGLVMDLDDLIQPRYGPMTPTGEIKHDIWGNAYIEPYRHPLPLADAVAQEDAIGIWRVPPQQAKEVKANPPKKGVYYSAPASFRYDGKYVTLALCNLHEWEWKSEDGFDRVKAKWKGNDLYWLPPFGSWAKLATFVNRHFEETNDDGIVWVYERVGPEFLAAYDQPLANEREPHDYAITPRGERRPGWRGDDD